MSRKREIEKLLDDIRNCDKGCPEDEEKNTPLVYSARNPKILIVSDIPPRHVWSYLGEDWKTSLHIPIEGSGTSTTLIKWLKITAANADRHFFWIQRVNCFVDSKSKTRVSSVCSGKFILRAINTVDPKVIITLGKPAAKWFFRFGALREIVGEDKTYTVDGKPYPFIALYHPSPANKKHIKDNWDKQQRGLGRARSYFKDL